MGPGGESREYHLRPTAAELTACEGGPVTSTPGLRTPGGMDFQEQQRTCCTVHKQHMDLTLGETPTWLQAPFL